MVELVDEPGERLWEAVEVGAYAVDEKRGNGVQLVGYFLTVFESF